MAETPALTSLEEDLLKELFNLGVGKAASSLSRMVKQEVLLSVPDIKFSNHHSLIEMLGNKQSIVSISQSIEGPFSAKSMLLFPESGSMEVVRQMLGQQLSDEMIAELQEEALSEIGNVVLNACIGAISKSLDKRFDVEIPSFTMALPEDLLEQNSVNGDTTILLIDINMTLKDSNIEGYLAFVFSPLSLGNLQLSLAELLKALK